MVIAFQQGNVGSRPVFWGSIPCFATFCLILWHSQWVLFITPLLAMLMFLESPRLMRYGLASEITLSFSFFAITFNKFPNWVDQRLLDHGLLSNVHLPMFSENRMYNARDVFFVKLPNPLWVALFNAVLIAILVSCFWERLSNKEEAWPSAFSVEIANGIRQRLILGLLFFLIPVFYVFLFRWDH